METPSSWLRQARFGGPFLPTAWAGESALAALKRYAGRYFIGPPFHGSSLARFSKQGRSHCSPARSGGPSPRPFHPPQLILKIFGNSALRSFSLALPGLDCPKSWLNCGLISAQLGSVEFSSVESNPPSVQISSIQPKSGPVWSNPIQFSLVPSSLAQSGQSSLIKSSPVQSNLAQSSPIQPG